MLKELKVQLETTLDGATRVHDILRRSGAVQLPTVIALEHFDRLVKYQIREMPFGQIAREDENGTGQQGIADGVKRAAELVIGPDFKDWLRPGKPGRPRKS
jgi:hypothetical protein